MRRRQLQSLDATSLSPKRPGQRCPTMAGSSSQGHNSQPIPTWASNSIPILTLHPSLLVFFCSFWHFWCFKHYSSKCHTFTVTFQWFLLPLFRLLVVLNFTFQTVTFTFQTFGGEPKPASLCHLLPLLPLGCPCQSVSHTIVIKVMMEDIFVMIRWQYPNQIVGLSKRELIPVWCCNKCWERKLPSDG